MGIFKSTQNMVWKQAGEKNLIRKMEVLATSMNLRTNINWQEVIDTMNCLPEPEKLSAQNAHHKGILEEEKQYILQKQNEICERLVDLPEIGGIKPLGERGEVTLGRGFGVTTFSSTKELSIIDMLHQSATYLEGGNQNIQLEEIAQATHNYCNNYLNN